MPAPYTIRIFVADGDPDGVRIIDRFNWTGKGFFFPRKKWSDIRKRPEFDFAGVYILFADAPSENGLPIVYVGEGDGLCARIDSHAEKKDFWSWGVAFVSANRGLNKAHVCYEASPMRDKCPERSDLVDGHVRGRVRPGDPTPSSQRRTEAGSRTGEARRYAARAQRRVLDAAEYDARLQPHRSRARPESQGRWPSLSPPR